MSVSGGVIDLGLRYGLRGKTFSAMNVPDYCGSQLGMTIGDYAARFPNIHYVLDTDLGWSDAEILQRTYFWSAYNDAVFSSYEAGAGFPYSRFDIKIPAGKWFYNAELRGPQGTTTGDGAFPYFGYGGTEIVCDHTNWKSLHGSQNDDTFIGFHCWTYCGEDGTSTNPIGTAGGYEWAHNFSVRDLCMSGTSNSGFNDNTYRECGIMYWWPGENSQITNCLFNEFNDCGVMISGSPAYANCYDCSFFHNAVMGIGIRGCARSTINLSVSGDFNPDMIRMFRQGDASAFTPNGVAYWPCFQNIAPGGDVTVQYAKIESFCCRGGFQTYSACTPNVPGKGQMLARLSGRFMFEVQGGGARCHDGQVDSLIMVVDDYFGTGGGVTGVPLDNSCIDIRGFHTTSFGHWVHNSRDNVKWQANYNDTDTQGSGCTIRFNQNGGNAYDVSNPTVLLGQTAATYKYRLPFSNTADPIPFRQSTGPLAGEGYQVFSGVAY